MKIGIYNIYTSFWFVFMLLSGGSLTYFSFDRKIFQSDLIFIAKFFVGIIILIAIGILIYFLFKFRILIIYNRKIITFHPFLLKVQNLDLRKIKNLKYENFYAFKNTVYRRLKITGFNGTLEINDLEFENFENLTTLLKTNKNKMNEINLTKAKSNKSLTDFYLFLISGLLIFILYEITNNTEMNLLLLIFLICNSILFLATLRRKIEYNRILKNGLQHRL